MSLKAFHIVFITASILLAFGFAAWSLVAYRDQGGFNYLIYGIGSALCGVALVFYEVYVLKKLKNISYL
jgi:hypothetical protein